MHAAGPHVGLVGRESGCTGIDGLLKVARSGDSGSVVARENRDRKTALLDYSADRAAGITVLRCSGVEASQTWSSPACTGRCARSRLPLRDPGKQSVILAEALGLVTLAGSDRCLVPQWRLSLPAAAAEAHPVLCVVDDAVVRYGCSPRRQARTRCQMPWADRAAAEPGEHPPAALPPRFTRQEQHIAGLVADGVTNSGMAAWLFLSPGPSTTTRARCLPSSGSPHAPDWLAGYPRTRPIDQQDRRSRRCEHRSVRGIVEACDQTQPRPPMRDS
jgi:hypothetical protein